MLRCCGELKREKEKERERQRHDEASGEKKRRAPDGRKGERLGGKGMRA